MSELGTSLKEPREWHQDFKKKKFKADDAPQALESVLAAFREGRVRLEDKEGSLTDVRGTRYTDDVANTIEAKLRTYDMNKFQEIFQEKLTQRTAVATKRKFEPDARAVEALLLGNGSEAVILAAVRGHLPLLYEVLNKK